MLGKTAVAAFMMIAGLTVASAAADAETLKIAIGTKGAWTGSMAEFGNRQGFFKDEGLDIDIYWTDGGALTLQAVLSNSADIAIDTGFLGVVGAYSKGGPIRVISPSSTGSPDIYWYAKAGGPIKTLADAAGKTMGFSQTGSSSDLVLLALLQSSKVTAKRVMTGNMPGTLTQVMTGQIDIGWAVPPFGLQELTDGQIIIIARGNDAPAIRNEAVRVNAANISALQTKREALVRFMRAYVRALDWAYRDPLAIDYYADLNHVSRPLAQKARDEFFPREQMQLDEIKGLDLVLQQAYDYKYIQRPMVPADFSGMFDMIRPSPAK